METEPTESEVTSLINATKNILELSRLMDKRIDGLDDRILNLTVAINYLISENLGNDEKARKIKELLHL